MKKLLIICGLLFSVITFAQAQDGQGGGRRGMGTPEERVKRSTEQLAEKLKLSDDQKTKVSAIYLEQANGMKKLRDDAAGDRDAMRAAMMKSNDETDAKINEVLTDDQKKAFTTFKEERKEAMKNRGQGGNGGSQRAGGQ